MGGGATTQTAAILFTDVVGSTALRARVGDVAGERIRRRHDHMLTGAVEAHRGTVIKNLGDGIMAVFGAPSDAVAGAVEIQQALTAYNLRPIEGERLSVRIGVSTGDVQVERGDYFGTPVVEAARLEAAAVGGQILASRLVQVLAGNSHRFGPPIGLELKGLEGTTQVVEVLWEPAARSPVPLPPELATDDDPFVGRVTERAALEAAWDAARAGHRSVVVMLGETGIGKSRLLREVAGDAHAAGATVLFGHCGPAPAIPHQPVVEALRHLYRHLADAVLADHLGALSGELVRILPELTARSVQLGRAVRSQPEIEQFSLFEAVVSALEATTTVLGPTLIAFEDIHLASPLTTRLLRHVLDASTGLPVLFVLTARDGEMTAEAAAMVDALDRLDGVEIFSLEGLDGEALGELAAQLLGADDADDDRGGTLLQATGGNVLLARELLRDATLSAAGEGRALAGDLTTGGVHAALGPRIDTVSGSCGRLLEVAAIQGLEFDVRVLRRASERDEEEVWSALEEAEGVGLIHAGSFGRCRFANAAYRSVFVERVGERSSALHHRISVGIEEEYGRRLPSRHVELAHHIDQAGDLVEADRAFHITLLAGAHALEQHGGAEALHWYGRADHHLARGASVAPRDRVELLLGRGRSEALLGRPEHHATLVAALEAAVELGDEELMRQAATASGRMFASGLGDVDTHLVALLRRGLDRAGPEATPTRARLLSRLAAELSFSEEGARAVELTGEAIQVARSCGDAETLAVTLATAYASIWHREMDSDELRAMADRVGDPGIAFLAEHQRANQASWFGDRVGCAAALDAAAQLSGSLGDPRATWLVDLSRAKEEMMHGRLESAEALATQALLSGQESGQADAFSFYGSQLLAIRWLEGRHGELAPLVETVDESLASIPAFRAARALVLAEVGRREEAETTLRQLAAAGFANQPVAASPIVPLFILGQLCAELADAAVAEELLACLAPFAGLHATSLNLWLGPEVHARARLLALVGRRDDALAAFDEARAVYTDWGCPTMAAMTAAHRDRDL